MGDIARVTDQEATLRLEVVTHAPIDRVEIRNGKDVIKVLRGFAPFQCGNRVRVLWSGAEYRGRGRQTRWSGKVAFDGARIARIAKINAWNPDRKLDVVGGNTVDFEAITTGNFGGFDAWLESGASGSVNVDTNLGALSVPLADLDHDGKSVEAGGLERRLRVFRLPEQLTQREMTTEVAIPLKDVGDNPLWVCVTTEDGHQAWSSPIFLFNRET